MKKEYLSIVIGIVALALVGQGIWLFNIYRANHANDFEITELNESVIPAKAGIQANLDPDLRRDDAPLTWSSRLINQSDKLISLAPGNTATLSATFENTGTSTWTNENTFLQILMDDETESVWYTTPWVGRKRVTRITESRVEPTKLGTFTFTIKTPSVPGTYTLALRPVYQEGASFKWLGANPLLAFTITVQNF